jgi:hypothetical protein
MYFVRFANEKSELSDLADEVGAGRVEAVALLVQVQVPLQPEQLGVVVLWKSGDGVRLCYQ